MAHLITHHDPFHVHKILGLLALLHFLYRAYLVLTTGLAFTPTEGMWTAVACVALHAALSWTSLLLPLTARRLFTAPMIWPEFRLHSILFASRHVLGAIACLVGAWTLGLAPGGGEEALPLTSPARLAVLGTRCAAVLGTTAIAKAITDAVGDAGARTTNAMPYPAGTGDGLVRTFKAFYAAAQFHATVHAVAGDATMAFAPLYAIQGAPFLMTLVRKGKIGAVAYHWVYTATLLVPYAFLALRLLLRPGDNALVWVVRALAGRLAIELRIHRRWGRVEAWATALLALSLLEVALDASGAHLRGPYALLLLTLWALRTGATKDGEGGAVEVEVAGKGRRAFTDGSGSANPFLMLPAMATLWRLGAEEAAAGTADGKGSADSKAQ